MTMKMDGAEKVAAAVADNPGGMVPCEDTTSDCVKRFCSLLGVALPLPQVAPPIPLDEAIVRYLPTTASRDGLSLKPELFPPIAT